MCDPLVFHVVGSNLSACQRFVFFDRCVPHVATFFWQTQGYAELHSSLNRCPEQMTAWEVDHTTNSRVSQSDSIRVHRRTTIIQLYLPTDLPGLVGYCEWVYVALMRDNKKAESRIRYNIILLLSVTGLKRVQQYSSSIIRFQTTTIKNPNERETAIDGAQCSMRTVPLLLYEYCCTALVCDNCCRVFVCRRGDVAKARWKGCRYSANPATE